MTTFALTGTTIRPPKNKLGKKKKFCQHTHGTIYNHKTYPATLEEPAEETGRVECNKCGEAWELGYEPEGMKLSIE